MSEICLTLSLCILPHFIIRQGQSIFICQVQATRQASQCSVRYDASQPVQYKVQGKWVGYFSHSFDAQLVLPCVVLPHSHLYLSASILFYVRRTQAFRQPDDLFMEHITVCWRWKCKLHIYVLEFISKIISKFTCHHYIS